MSYAYVRFIESVWVMPMYAYVCLCLYMDMLMYALSNVMGFMEFMRELLLVSDRYRAGSPINQYPDRLITYTDCAF